MMYRKLNVGIAYLFIMFIDYLAILAAIFLALYVREGIADILHRNTYFISKLYIYVIVPLIYIFFHQIRGVYKWQIPFWKKSYQVVVADTYYLGAILFLLYLAHVSSETSRLFFLIFACFVYGFSLFAAYITRVIVRRIAFFQNQAIIVGKYDDAMDLREIYKASHSHRIHIIGYVDLNWCPINEKSRQKLVVAEEKKIEEIPCLGSLDNIESIITQYKIDDVLIAMPDEAHSSLRQAVAHRVQPFVKYVYFVASVGKLAVTNLEINLLEDGKVVVFSIKNNLCVSFNRILKRSFDTMAAFFGGLLILPVLIFIGVWIYVDDPGPIIFKQRRIGQRGKEFTCYKFRSMCVDAHVRLEELLAKDPVARHEWEATQKLKDDPRITKSGAFLRASSLDELPQIWNVIKGEMSLVGPRPIVRSEIEKYGDYIDDYYLTRPGMTGLWQTSGRNDVSYANRVQMDSWYVRNWSLWLDLVLIFRTIKTVLFRKGAY